MFYAKRYILPKAGIIALSISTSVLVADANAVRADTMVCEDPAHVLDERSHVYLMHRVFNASSSSKRFFSEVHYHEPADPHLTIGMGHWVGGNVAKLFSRLRKNETVWNDLTNVWADSLNEKHWKQFRRETAVSGTDAQALSDGIDKVLCASDPRSSCVRNRLVPWTRKVKERFNDTGHWFTNGWKLISRKNTVARLQVLHWSESVLKKGLDDAAKRGITNRGGVASVISARSSSLGATMFSIGSTNPKARRGSLSRQWSLVRVPENARPKNQPNVDEDRLLQDWRAVAAWQFYTVKKGRVRSRMRAIWDVFYSPSWGTLKNPSSLKESTETPKHKGCFMDDAPFDFAVRFSSEPLNCSKSVPKLSAMSVCGQQ